MTLKNRLAQLEKNRRPLQQASDIENIRVAIMAKLRAVLNGEVLPVQPSNPATDALRAEILQRLQRIADQAKP